MACTVYILVFCSLLLVQSYSQQTKSTYTPYDDLPDKPRVMPGVAGGNFTSPTGNTEIYSEGRVMTLRWVTDYAAVNLYLRYYGANDADVANTQDQIRRE